MPINLGDLAINVSVTGAAPAATALGHVETAGHKAAGGATHAADSMRKLEHNIASLIPGMGILRTGLEALAIREVATKAIELSDAYTVLQNRLAIVTSGSIELARVQERLFEIAQESRQSMDATAAMYGRLALAGEELKIPQEDLLKATEAFSLALKLSRTSSEEAQGAINNFSMGLQTGTIEMRSFRTILREMPALGEAMAHGLGLTVGQMREMVKAGHLSPQQLIGGLIRGLDELKAKHAKTLPTIHEGFTQVGNAIGEMVGHMDHAIGASHGLTKALRAIADLITNDNVLFGIQGAFGGAAFAMNARDARRAPGPFDVSQSAAHRMGQSRSPITITGEPDKPFTGTLKDAPNWWGDAGLAAIQGAKWRQEFMGSDDSQWNADPFVRERLAKVRANFSNAFSDGMKLTDKEKRAGEVGGIEFFDLDKMAKKLENATQKKEAAFRAVGLAIGQSVAAGISTAVSTGNIGKGFEDMLSGLLGGLGSVVERMGEEALASAIVMKIFKEAMSSFNPEIGILVALEMIAVGAGMQALAGRSSSQRAIPVGAPSGAVGTSTTVIDRGTVSYSAPSAPSGASVGAASSLVMARPISLTVIGAGDPVAQRQLVEMIRNADRRGGSVS